LFHQTLAARGFIAVGSTFSSEPQKDSSGQKVESSLPILGACAHDRSCWLKTKNPARRKNKPAGYYSSAAQPTNMNPASPRTRNTFEIHESGYMFHQTLAARGFIAVGSTFSSEPQKDSSGQKVESSLPILGACAHDR